jgi:hypothetical protein
MSKQILFSALVLFSFSPIRSQNLPHTSVISGTKFYVNQHDPKIALFADDAIISELPGTSLSLFKSNDTNRLDSTIYENPGDEINSWTTEMRVTFTYDSDGYILQRMQYEYETNGVHIVQKDYTNDSLSRITKMVQKHSVSEVWDYQWD